MSTPAPDHSDPVELREQQLLDEIADAQDSPLTIEVRQEGELPVVRLSGELDVATADQFNKRLTDVLSGSPRGVIIDLARLSFLDSKGLAVFLRASTLCPGKVAVVSPRERISRLFQATGLAERLLMRPTVAEGIAALD